MKLEVKHDRDRQTFYAVRDGRTSTLEYEKRDASTLDFKSTFVPEEQRHNGVGSELVRQALEHARSEDYEVVPSCPFVASYVESHPEHGELTSS